MLYILISDMRHKMCYCFLKMHQKGFPTNNYFRKKKKTGYN